MSTASLALISVVALAACGSSQSTAGSAAASTSTVPATTAVPTRLPATTRAPATTVRKRPTTPTAAPTTHVATTVAPTTAAPTTTHVATTVPRTLPPTTVPRTVPPTAPPTAPPTTAKPIVTSTTTAPRPAASLWLSPGAEYFPRVPSPSQPMPPLTVTVVNNGSTVMNSVVVHPVGVYSVPSSSCGTLKPGQSCSAVVQFCPTAPGSYPATLAVSGVSAKGTYVQVSIPLHGTAG
jgi:hypothetical protein